MAITYVTGANGHVAGGNNLTLNLGATPAADDVLIAHFTIDDTAIGQEITPPAGWIEYGYKIRTGIAVMIYYKIAGASETTGQTFGTSGTTKNVVGQIAVFRGVDKNSPFIDGNTWDHNNTSTLATAVTVEGVHSIIDTVSVAFYSTGYNTVTFTPPSGVTEVIDYNDAASVSIGSYYTAAATAEGKTASASVGISASITHIHSYQFSLRPANNFVANVLKSGIPTKKYRKSSMLNIETPNIAHNSNAFYLLTTNTGANNALYVYDHAGTQLQTIVADTLYANFQFNKAGYNHTMSANDGYIYFTDRSSANTDNFANIMRHPLNADGTLATGSPTVWKDVDGVAGDKNDFIAVEAGKSEVRLIKGDQFYRYKEADGTQTANLTLSNFLNMFDDQALGTHFHSMAVNNKHIIASAREYGCGVWNLDGTVAFGETATAGATTDDIARLFYKFFGMGTFEVAGNGPYEDHYVHYSFSELTPNKVFINGHYGNYDWGGYTVTYEVASGLYNTAPNAPVIDSPKGTSTSPGFVQTLTPTLDWTFSDPDAGDSQSAHQVVVYNPDGTILKDTLKVASADTFHNIVSTDALAWDVTYSFKVKTWDSQGVEGPFSALEYFQPNKAPTATNLTPGSTDSTTPEGVATTGRLSWTYSDNEGEAQAHYQVKIYDMATTPALVHDSTKIASANAYYDIPSGALTAGVKYQYEVSVWDPNGLTSTSAREYIITNATPGAPTLTIPVDTKRVPKRPVFEATIGDDPENNNQHFIIQIADDSGFTTGLQERSTETAVTGWEAKTSTGSFVAMPTGGVDSSYEGGTVRHTWQADLTEGKTYYWRKAAIDVSTGSRGAWSTARSIRVGNVLAFVTDAIVTSAAAKRIVMNMQHSIATDGTAPATLKVEAANNANDAAPTWEDMTAAVNSGNYFNFTNTAKTATDWAVAVRVTIDAKDSLGAIEIDGLGFSFD